MILWETPISYLNTTPLIELVYLFAKSSKLITLDTRSLGKLKFLDVSMIKDLKILHLNGLVELKVINIFKSGLKYLDLRLLGTI